MPRVITAVSHSRTLVQLLNSMQFVDEEGHLGSSNKVQARLCLFLPGIASYTARSWSSSNSRGRRSSSTTTSKTNSIFTREVVLLNNSNNAFIVRGKKKADLMRNGQVHLRTIYKAQGNNYFVFLV